MKMKQWRSKWSIWKKSTTKYIETCLLQKYRCSKILKTAKIFLKFMTSITLRTTPISSLNSVMVETYPNTSPAERVYLRKMLLISWIRLSMDTTSCRIEESFIEISSQLISFSKIMRLRLQILDLRWSSLNVRNTLHIMLALLFICLPKHWIRISIVLRAISGP